MVITGGQNLHCAALRETAMGWHAARKGSVTQPVIIPLQRADFTAQAVMIVFLMHGMCVLKSVPDASTSFYWFVDFQAFVCTVSASIELMLSEQLFNPSVRLLHASRASVRSPHLRSL